MKTLPILLHLLATIVIMIGIHFYLSGEDHRNLLIRQKEIDRITLKNKQEADSLLNVIRLKNDSLLVAHQTILLQADTIKLQDKERLDYKRNTHDKIHFFRSVSDAGRDSTLAKLYTSFRPIR